MGAREDTISRNGSSKEKNTKEQNMNANRKRIFKNGRSIEKHKKIESTTPKQSAHIFVTWDDLNIIFEIISQPLFMIGIHLICNEKQCSFTAVPDISNFHNLSFFFNSEVFLHYLGYVTILFFFNWFPFVNEKVTVGDFTYNFVGFNMCAVMIVSHIFLEIIGIPISYYIDHHVMHFVVSAMLFQMSFGIFLYIYSFLTPNDRLNPQEIGTSFLRAFYNGRQINPRLFNRVELKYFLVEIISINSVLIELALTLRGLNLVNEKGLNLNNLNWTSLTSHPTLVVLVLIHSLYVMCILYYESRLLSSYYIMSEGIGYNTAMATSTRFSGLLAQTIYLKEHKVHYPNWQLIGLFTLFMVAFYIFNVTNTQKDHFKRYPNSLQSKRMKKISTPDGKHILCDGWWAVVRQPNIMADFLIHLSFIRFGLTTPTVLSLISFFYYFILRAKDSQRNCEIKYSPAWQIYCSKVKYVLFPYIY